MDRTQLVSAWDAVRELPFPSAPQDQDLADWLFDLLEADRYYGGIATSAIADERSSLLPRADELEELADRLEHLRVSTPNDRTILQHCHAYLRALLRLHEVMLS